MMQLKRFFFGAFGLLVLASCSNDELTSVNRDGDEIAFSVVTNPATRAANVFCNNNKPSSFKVWATYNDATYINGDEITYDDPNDKWVNTSGTRYWPDDEVLFFAHVNANDKFMWNNGSPKIDNFTVEIDVAIQKDLLYAVKKASKADDQAKLNFRHALSQIVFRAKNTNKNLYVEISGVSVCKVSDKNTFTYPLQNTDNNIENHTGASNTSTINYENDSWGTWNDLANGTTSYSVEFTPVEVPGDSEVKSLTSENETGEEFSNQAMLLLPQSTTAWDVNSNDAKGKPADQEGTYFLVKCRIFNVAGDKVNTDTDVCLWGEDGAADAAIPVALNWEQGKKYIYTFVFGDGNGGYNPEPDGPKPEPVLVPITFSVTVDDFVNAAEEEIEMNEPKATEGGETEA